MKKLFKYKAELHTKQMIYIYYSDNLDIAVTKVYNRQKFLGDNTEGNLYKYKFFDGKYILLFKCEPITIFDLVG